MKRALIMHEDVPTWGTLQGDDIVLASGKRVPAAQARYLPPVRPSKIIACHLSYRSRCMEYKMKRIPEYPSYFMKPPSSLSHHGATVARPRGCKFLNYEGEIGVVIGRRCSNVPMEGALDYVRGYVVANDWGVHDFRHADRGSMLRVKGHDGFCPVGPFIVDAADIDPNDITLRTYVNGRVVQEAHTGSDLIFSFAYQIADLSRLITLEEGDLLLTGTPANSRPVNIGDVVEVEASGIGRLTNTVVELERDLVPVGEPPRISANTLHVALAIPEDEAERLAVEQQQEF
ncbi:MAG: fumarylacetoacetate hydrolase family protein [Thermoflexales bacterium]|nr:fumarylacetoacetate hydrolase family protein [Thermoflexales bacterium]MDW8351894.1 fumarylacetoacetate hydrolase family protein [Anaerolineae bacterium]